MNQRALSTEPYKGTRDFYPADMAVQQYIFKTWAHAAELFGFERYDASVLEPSDLYKSKGAENEEMVNEQTYTFIDRGDREVTLRPEMTPTVARMVAGQRRELSFPVRWYSIPNLYRYERPQRGRLREHWQLNCDIFGTPGIATDVEIIALAHRVLTEFGAHEDMFVIRINHRGALNAFLAENGITDDATIRAVTAVIDKKAKMPASEFVEKLTEAAGRPLTLPSETPVEVAEVISALGTLGIQNVVYDASIVRGFNYYTGIVFEVTDTAPENNRSLLGGGRYDNLTELFGGEPISGIGFGMGDVSMHDFLETHNLLPESVRITAPTLMILPTDEIYNLQGEKIAQEFRAHGITTSVEVSTKKMGKKISNAADAGVAYIIAIGEDEIASQIFTLKKLATKEESTGPLSELISTIR